MTEGIHKIRALLADAEKRLAAARERVEKAQREVERSTVEVSAFQKALEMLGGGETESLEKNRRNRETEAAAHPAEKWIAIYARLIETKHEPYDYEDIRQAAASLGFDVTEGNMRTQMMNAVKGRHFARQGPGRFVVTAEGLAAFGVDTKKNEPPKGGSSEEVGPSSVDDGREGHRDPSGGAVHS